MVNRARSTGSLGLFDDIPFVTLPPSSFRETFFLSEARASFRARCRSARSSFRRKSIMMQKPEAHKPRVNRHMIWAENEHFTGWCCSHCLWGLIAPRLETTVAALAFNRVAQEGFAKHACLGGAQAETRPSPPYLS